MYQGGGLCSKKLRRLQEVRIASSNVEGREEPRAGDDIQGNRQKTDS